MSKKKYTDFPVGTYDTSKIFLQADASTGELTQVNLPTISASSTWGSITGTLSSQTDLQSALSALYPLTGNPSGFITSVPAQSFSSLTGKPTTVSGYGITDAVDLTSTQTITGLKTFANIYVTGSIRSNAGYNVITTGNYGVTIGLNSNSTTPLAGLMLRPGLASEYGAPMKFSSGVNLTTPENGAVEYDGTHLYFTTGSTRYQLDQQSVTSLAWSAITGTPTTVSGYGITDAALDANVVHLAGTETISGTKTFTPQPTFTAGIKVGTTNAIIGPAGYAVLTATSGEISVGNTSYNAILTAAASTTVGFKVGSVYTIRSTSSGLKVSTAGTTVNATAQIEIGAGVATAGGAPLKLNSGVNLTTPENGAVEYDGNHLYFSIGTTRWQLDQQGGGGGSLAWSAITGKPTTLSGYSISDALSNTYNPSLTNTTNVSTSTLSTCSYIRIGNIVNVSLGFNFTPTSSSTATVLTITLPITTTTGTQNLVGGGICTNGTATVNFGAKVNVVSTTTAQILMFPPTGVAVDLPITFQYTL